MADALKRRRVARLERLLGLRPGVITMATEVSRRIEAESEEAWTDGNNLRRVDVYLAPFGYTELQWHYQFTRSQGEPGTKASARSEVKAA